MPTRNEVLMRSANLLNDFAFKYVFGEDCKEANDALKSFLTVFLERKVVNVQVTNEDDYPILEAIVQFDDNTKMKIAILIDHNIVKLQRLSEYYLMRLFGSQEEFDLNPCQVIGFYDGKESEFEIDLQFRNDDGILFFPDGMLKISVYSIQNLDKPYDQMNAKEKMVHYFLNYRDKNKVKMLENDKVIQMLEKRVETISDEDWTKWIEDFRIQQENEERMERQLELEELQKAKEETRKLQEETRKAQEEVRKAQEEVRKAQEEADKKFEEANKQVEQMIHKMYESGLSPEQISSYCSLGVDEIREILK